MQTRLTRDQVPQELTWNLQDLYATPADWEADFHRVQADLDAVTAFRGRLGSGAAVLLACVRALDALRERVGRVVAYASLHTSTDGTSPENQAMGARAGALMARVQAGVAFLTPELLSLPEDTLAGYLAAEPGLEPYRNQLDEVLRERPHTLLPETEEALAALGETLNAPATIYQHNTLADLDFPPIRDAAGQELPMSIEQYERLEQSPDRELRRQAYAAVAAGLNRHKTTLAATLATCIKRNVAMARLRRYGSAAELFLHPQQVPLEVYHNVLDIVHDEAAPHVRRLMVLRQRLLGVDRLHRYDLNAPLDPAYDPPATFADSARLIQAGLRPLGPEYGQILEAAFRHRWVDLADNAGKSSGAFCSTVYGVHSFVLMTWKNSMRDAFVLAHELGHAGHGMLAARHQIISNQRVTRFFVEAPSTANELLLGHHILDTTGDRRLRRWVIIQFLRTFMHNMVTHLLEAHLERRLYEMAEAGKPLTVSTIMAAQGEVFERFYAGTVVVDDGARLNWMRVPHFYVGLYPFTYAAGLSCGYFVVESIRREGQPAVDRWLQTLKAGGTLPPLELMQMAGVDMRRPDPIRRAVRFFGQLVDELEQSYAH